MSNAPRPPSARGPQLWRCGGKVSAAASAIRRRCARARQPELPRAPMSPPTRSSPLPRLLPLRRARPADRLPAQARRGCRAGAPRLRDAAAQGGPCALHAGARLPRPPGAAPHAPSHTNVCLGAPRSARRRLRASARARTPRCCGRPSCSTRRGGSTLVFSSTLERDTHDMCPGVSWRLRAMAYIINYQFDIGMPAVDRDSSSGNKQLQAASIGANVRCLNTASTPAAGRCPPAPPAGRRRRGVTSHR